MGTAGTSSITGGHWAICIDRMYFDERGRIRPVVITDAGVRKQPLK
jgi:hypothetical protein